MTDDQAKQMLRRQDSIEKTLNLIFKDREILEDVLVRLGTLEDKVKLLTDRHQSMEKNTKADLKDVIENVENIKDEVQKVAEVIT